MAVASFVELLFCRKQFYNKGCAAFSINLYTRNNHNSKQKRVDVNANS